MSSKVPKLFFVLFLGVFSLFPQSSHAMAATVEVSTTVNDVTKTYTCPGDTLLIDGSLVSTKKLPPVQIDSVWMMSGEEVFNAKAGCTYEFQESTGTIIITRESIDTVLTLQLNSETVVIRNAGKEDTDTLDAAPVLAVNKSSGEQGIYVPAEMTAFFLGFDYSYDASNQEIHLITTTYLDLDRSADSYDTSIFNNTLQMIYLSRDSDNSRQEFECTLKNTYSREDVAVEENLRQGSIKYTFYNTFNPFGDISYTFSSSYVKNVSISMKDNSTVIQVNFKKKYIINTSMLDNELLINFTSTQYSLLLDLPEGVAVSDIQDEDIYYNKQFVLTLPGRWKNFYQDNPVIENSSVIKKISVKENSKNTLITITTSKLQGYKLIQNNKYCIIQVDSPRKIYKNIVVLDAGHGGRDDGAKNRGTKEKKLNYTIIYTLAKKYFDAPESNVKAYWSRYDDTFISLYQRSRFASEVGADLFVSLHMNSCSRSSVNGMEIYYSKDNNSAAKTGLTSKKLANTMLDQLLGDLNASNRGVKSAGFYVIKHNTVPAILIELGFLSGNSDYKKLTSSSYQKKAAKSIYTCVEDIFKKYPTGR